MATATKLLGKVTNPPFVGATLYTVPAGHVTLVKSVRYSNHGPNSSTIYVTLADPVSGDLLYIADALVVAPGQTGDLLFSAGSPQSAQALAVGDQLQVAASVGAGSTVTIWASGSEILVV